jgi:glycosyltransferase involved in cell wall biosynthesis
MQVLPHRMSLRLENHKCQFAMVTLAFEGGGPERDTVMLCNGLAAKGVRVTILVLREEGPLRSLLDPAVHVIVLPTRRIRYATPALRRIIRMLGPAVVVSSGIPSLNLATLLAVRTLPRGQRPNLVLREVGVPSMARHDPARSNRIAYQILRRLYRHTDCVITQTDATRRELTQYFSIPETKISVMGLNAVIPPSLVRRLKQWDGEAGRERDLILCVGRLSREKDHRTLLRAMTLMSPERPWRLAILGDGPERAALEAFARSHGLAERTLFAGYVPDVFTWMMRASVVVLSSIYEGLPCVIMEALACGTPVVSTDCPHGPREILEGGRYGTLTPVGDPAAMATAIAAALDRVPDRILLTRRGLEYTAELAAQRFLQIVAALEPKPTYLTGSLLGADMS